MWSDSHTVLADNIRVCSRAWQIWIFPMITAMVAGYYEPNGNEVYPPGADAYGEYCYGMQDMCNHHMPCNFHGK